MKQHHRYVSVYRISQAAGLSSSLSELVLLLCQIAALLDLQWIIEFELGFFFGT